MKSSPEEQKKIAQAGRFSLIDFSIITLPTYKPNWHHEILASKLEAVEKGEVKRLMVFMPPRSGKSQLTTINLPAWYLGRNPNKEVITVSYNAELATEFGGKTRDIIADPIYQIVFSEGIKLKGDERAKGRWRTDKGGSYTSVGMGGGITGRGCHLLILDDIIKNPEEAESKLIRDKQWDWYRSVAYSRLEKDAAIVITLTRWHLDDLAGRLLAEQDKGGDKWEVIEFPAIAVKDEQYRKIGEPLWPDKYNLDNLNQTKKTVGLYYWNAMYQQNPVLSEHQEFKPGNILYRSRSEVDALNTRRFLTIDTAYSQKQDADFCGIVKNYVDRENKWNISAFRMRMSPGQLIDYLFRSYQDERFEIIGIEKTAYLVGLKKAIDDEMLKRNTFLPIKELEHREINKHTRIRALLPRYEIKSVYHIEGECSDLEEEMFAFPRGAKNDVLDALAYQSQIAEAPSVDDVLYQRQEAREAARERTSDFL